MPSQGPRSPGTVVNDASIGSFAWSNPSNALTSNDSRAQLASSMFGISNYLKATNFGFTIPAGATITGIKVEAEGSDRGQAGNLTDESIVIVKADGTKGSWNMAFGGNWPTSEAIRTWGGDGNMWDETWTPAAINDPDFGVAIALESVGGQEGASVDHIRITVYYVEITALTKVVNETVQLVETSARVTGLKRSINETLQITETTPRLLFTKVVKVVNESVQWIEQNERWSSLKRVITETVQMIESSTVARQLRRVVNEQVSITESASSDLDYSFTTLTEVLAGMSTSIREASSATPDPQSRVVRLNGQAGQRIRGLLDVERRVPIGVGAQVLHADLLLYPTEDWSGTHTITIEAIDEAWDAATATWTTQPSVRAGSIALAVTDAAADAPIVIDLTAMIAASIAADDASAERWFGVLVSIDTTGERSIHSAVAEPTVRPRVQIEWSVPPMAPEDLLPNGGRYVSEAKPELVARHFDADAEDTMDGIHVQVATVEDFATTVYDSGELPHTAPRFDLNAPPTGAPVVPTLAADDDHWHRMKTKDNHGLWSDWSSGARFRVHAKGVLTLVAPLGPTVSSPTPTIEISFTGTQTQVELEVYKRVGGIWEAHYRVPKHVGAETSFTLPDSARLSEAETYLIVVRIWDDFDREDMAGDRAFVEASREITLEAVA